MGSLNFSFSSDDLCFRSWKQIFIAFFIFSIQLLLAVLEMMLINYCRSEKEDITPKFQTMKTYQSADVVIRKPSLMTEGSA